MGLKYYKPKTSTRRHSSVVDYSGIAKKPQAPKRFFLRKPKSGGRSDSGSITVRHIGGGAKKILRVVDNRREKFDIPAKVKSIEYDPNRTGFIALVAYRDGAKSYILAPEGLKIGDPVVSSLNKVEVRPGNRTRLLNLPAGTFVHDIELMPGKGGQAARGAGSYATLMGVESQYAVLKMPSGETRRFLANSRATIGQVSNPEKMNVRIGKAGRTRHMGIRPTVRGKAMNPVDHPHGGGEGRNPIGLKYPKTPWGKHALGVKTRRKYRESNKFIIQRRK